MIGSLASCRMKTLHLQLPFLFHLVLHVVLGLGAVAYWNARKLARRHTRRAAHTIQSQNVNTFP